MWEGYGYGSSGISWIAPDTLAFGNGTDGDVSGAAAMTALVLFGSASYYGPYNDYDVDYGPSYDQFYTSIFSGATQNWNLILPPNPGASGQVLTTNGTGVTYWSTVSGGGGGTSPGGSNGDIQYNNSGAFGGSAATITAAGSITLPDTQVIMWGGSAYSSVGLSQLAADTLAVGNGSDSDVSGAMAMTALILYGSSYYSAYDAFQTTILSGATQDWALVLPETAGTAGQVLTNLGSGFTAWESITAIGVPWSSLTNPTTNLSLTMGTDTTTFNYATGLAAAFLWANNTPTVTGSSTTLALSTVTAPTHSGGVSWTYTLASSASGAGSNGWVNASVTISGYTGGATGNNGTFTITASTTTTVTVSNATGTTINTGTTPVMISSAVSSSPILQIAGTVNTGGAGTLNSVADIWSIQNIIGQGSVQPNPLSTLTFSHTGTSGIAAVSVPFLIVGSGSNPCSISSPSGGLTSGIDINANGVTEIIQNGVTITEFNTGTTAIAVGAGACINWQNTTSPSNTTNTDLLLSRVSPSILGIGSVSTLGNFGGSLVSTGVNSDGGLLLQQYTTVVSAPTVTPATAGSTSYSYEIVALDVNMHPIGASAAGTTALAASTITTTNTITITWTAVAGAFAYAVYRSASGGTPSTTGLLSNSQTITGITTGTSTMILACSSVIINADIVGQLITVSGSSHANNNGYFYCTAATATAITLFNPYAVAEASPPASAAFIGGVVPASTLSIKDPGYTANGVAAPTSNTSGSLAFVASYESATSGVALSQDIWSIYPVVASGLNGASTLTFAHAGSTGAATLSIPTVSKYGDNATTKNGLAPILATSIKTAQAAAQSAVSLVASTSAAGMWRVSFVATITTAASAAAVLGGATGFTITYVNGNGDTVTKTTALSTPLGIGATNSTADSASGDLYCYSGSATAISYSYGYTAGTGTPMQYDIAVYAEFLG